MEPTITVHADSSEQILQTPVEAPGTTPTAETSSVSATSTGTQAETQAIAPTPPVPDEPMTLGATRTLQGLK